MFIDQFSNLISFLKWQGIYFTIQISYEHYEHYEAHVSLHRLFLISSYDFDSVVLFLTGFKSLLTFSNALLLSSYKVFTLQKREVCAQLFDPPKCFKICHIYGKRKPM